MRIIVLVLLVVAGCASRAAPCTTLKAENKRLNDDLADARRHEAETDAKLKALELKVAQLDQATKTRESELAKLRTDSSASARELADARAKVDAAAKKLPPVCPPGTMLDATGTICMQAPPPVVTPPVAPPVAPSPVVARVIKIEVTTDGVLCTLGAGSAQGVAKTWTARFLREDSGVPLPGGSATLVRINKTTTVITVKMTTDAINRNPNVVLSPP